MLDDMRGKKIMTLFYFVFVLLQLRCLVLDRFSFTE